VNVTKTRNGEQGTGIRECVYSSNFKIVDKGKEKGLRTSFEHALFQCDLHKFSCSLTYIAGSIEIQSLER